MYEVQQEDFSTPEVLEQRIAVAVVCLVHGTDNQPE